MEECTKAYEANSDNAVRDVHNITLVRNNSHAQKMSFMKDEHIFFMLDYFNFLKERSIDHEKQGYMALCGVDRDSSDAAVRKSMGIYALPEQKMTADGEHLFKVGIAGKSETSSTPFLGIVQIYIINYEWDKCEESILLKNVRRRLIDYGEKINEVIQEMLSEDDVYQIFQTVTSEDFCAVIHTSTAQKIYDVVTELMKLKDSKGKRLLFTYTNVGIESARVTDMDVEFLHLNPLVCESNQDVRFVVRFRLEADVIKKFKSLFQEGSDQFQLESVNGLFGRYDMVLQISINEFTELYPFLCKSKAGYPIDDLQNEKFNSKLVLELVKEMKAGTIRTINTRILLNLYSATNRVNENKIKPWFDETMLNQIKARSAIILDLSNRFKKKYEVCFLLDKYRYEDLKKMLDRLMNLYENLAYEFDTHLNWFVCSQYLEDLFNNMYAYMERADKQDREALNKYMNEFQMFINAFEAYIKLLQGMNQHTNQAPQYDIVAPIDGQKFLIAFSEYLNRIHEVYCDFDWKNQDKHTFCVEQRRKARVLIYPEMTRKNVEMISILENKGKEAIKDKDAEMAEIPSILLCRIPMFEYFERVYDLIPLVSHEICHRMLILSRKERNDFFIGRILYMVSREICFQMQLESCNGSYVMEGDALYELFVKQLKEVLINEYKDINKGWENYVSTYIPVSIEDFINQYLISDKEKRYIKQGSMKWADIMKSFDELIHEVGFGQEERNILQDIQKFYENKDTDWRISVHKNAKVLYDKLLNTIETNAGITGIWEKSQSKKYKDLDACFEEYFSKKHKFSEEKSKYEIKSGMEYLRRLHTLYSELLQYDVSNEKEKSRQILEKFAKNVCREVTDDFLKGDRYCIYSQDKMERILYWEVLNPELAVKHYIDFFAKLNFNEICKYIDRNNIMYRESCADIIMCKWLGFNSFGYLRLAVTFWERMEGYYKEMTKGELIKERLVTVLTVLLRNEGVEGLEEERNSYTIAADSLEIKLHSYIQFEIKFAEDKITRAVEDDANIECKDEEIKKVKKFFEIFKDNIDDAWENVKHGKIITWEDGIWDQVCRMDSEIFDENSVLRGYFQKEINLYQRIFWMLYAFSEIVEDGRLQIDKDVLDHMWKIYENMNIKEEKHYVVEEVVKFYNDPESEGKTNFEKMKDMLLFVQDYYYYNRFRKMWEEASNENMAC